MDPKRRTVPGLSRRSLLRSAGTGALAAGLGGTLAACGGGSAGSRGSSGRTITIGFVTPLTGALAGYAAGDQFVLSAVRASAAYANGFPVGGKKYQVSIVVADSQSDPNQAGQVARDLIQNRRPDMIVTTSTAETTNPVAQVCQSQNVPCLASVVPWESWYAGLGGNPQKPVKPFQYCAMFFFGLPEYAGCYTGMWNRIGAGKTVACLYPNDAGGNLFRAGLIPLIRAAGYRPADGGAYTDGTTSYTRMLSAFAAENSAILSSAALPADFSTFWRQASQQGFRPRLATVTRALQFPADAAALGPLAASITTAMWWGPAMLHASSLDGTTARALAAAYQARTGRQWVQSLGPAYSLFEVAREAFTAVSDPHNGAEVAAALHKVSYTGMCGALDFSSGPAPGVAILKPAGGQWQRASGQYPFELQVVDNSLNPAVPLTAALAPTSP